jgi:hypothetical protein
VSIIGWIAAYCVVSCLSAPLIGGLLRQGLREHVAIRVDEVNGMSAAGQERRARAKRVMGANTSQACDQIEVRSNLSSQSS